MTRGLAGVAGVCAVEWPHGDRVPERRLIVPLYDQGQPLGATRIEVTDVDPKAVILTTDLP